MMIAKDVNYGLAIDEWKALLDSGKLDRRQKKDARWQLAGLQAEKDMAYYLGVHLRDSDDFRVFHNLKVEHNGDTAQIDHLVLTRWIAYFIESKSISDAISVNEHGEWFRVYRGRTEGMPSPLEQSIRHLKIFYSFLEDNREHFMGKALGLVQKNFKRLLSPAHFVAISSRGKIEGPGRSKFTEVVKADQIPSKILEHHEGLRKGPLSTSLNSKDMEAFNPKEFDAVTEFLLDQDTAQTPLEQVHEWMQSLGRKKPQSKSKAPSQNPQPRPAAVGATKDRKPETGPSGTRKTAAEAPLRVCRHCDSANLNIRHGPYGYYFKCRACEGNTPIRETCPQCAGELRVNKSGPEFFLVCKACETREHFWTN